MMDNSQREKENNRANRDKTIRDLFKVAAFFVTLKGIKILTDKFN